MRVTRNGKSAAKLYMVAGMWPTTHLPKQVGKFDLEGNLIEVFPSIYSAAKSMGARQWEVSRCVNGKRKTFKGFVWKYV